jgi:transposase-like protein/IS1 family transposase
VTCIKCEHGNATRFGTYGPKKIQRYRCSTCRATFAEPRHKPLGKHYTDVETAGSVVALLMEGMSIRAVSRLLGISKNTILRLLITVGGNCRRLLGERMHNLHPKFVQADELWTYVAKKQKRLLPGDAPEKGDTYVWIALDSDTKAVLAYYVGKRDERGARALINQLRSRIDMDEPFQLTTDGFDKYVPAVQDAFGQSIDFAQLIKIYSQPVTTGPDWFRPSHVVGVRREPVTGDPDPARISTSHVERFNLTVRMHVRRFARLTNAFSKSLLHLRAAVALFIAFYNFCKPHMSLRVTPAMESGLTDHVWSIEELLVA